MGNSQGAVLPGAVPEPVKCEKFKILLLGPPNVGKSCIFKRYVSMRFEQLYQPDLTANIGACACVYVCVCVCVFVRVYVCVCVCV